MKLFNEQESMSFLSNCKHFELLPEEVLDHPTLTMNDLNPSNMMDRMLLQKHKKLSGYSFFLVHKYVTEVEVGVGYDNERKYDIIWELVREQNVNGVNYVIFSGWGDQMHGGYRQFESKEIGFTKSVVAKILLTLMTKFPNDFPLEKMTKIKEINCITLTYNPITGSKNLNIIDN